MRLNMIGWFLFLKLTMATTVFCDEVVYSDGLDWALKSKDAETLSDKFMPDFFEIGPKSERILASDIRHEIQRFVKLLELEIQKINMPEEEFNHDLHSNGLQPEWDARHIQLAALFCKLLSEPLVEFVGKVEINVKAITSLHKVNIKDSSDDFVIELKVKNSESELGSYFFVSEFFDLAYRIDDSSDIWIVFQEIIKEDKVK